MNFNLDNLTDEEFEIEMNKAINYNDTNDKVGDDSAEDDSVEDESSSEDVNTDSIDGETEDNPDNESNAEEDVSSDEEATADDEVNLDKGEKEAIDDESDLEQSINDNEQDSNDEDADSKNSEDKDEEDSDVESSTVDESQENVDDNNGETDAVETEENNLEETKKRKLRADGVLYEFTEEERDSLAEKGINYTKKMQAISPWRKSISALESENLTHEDINLMIDAFKGNKDAIASILKRTGVEAIDLNTENEESFEPNNYGKSNAELDIEETTSVISSDPEYPITYSVINNQWDDASRESIYENPKLISSLHLDVKSGMFNKVSPVAMSMKVLDEARGLEIKSDLEYYKQAGSEVIGNMIKEDNRASAENEQNKKIEDQKKLEAKQKRDRISNAKSESLKRSDLRKKESSRMNASTTSSSSGTKTVVDYLNTDSMSDDEFSKMMDKELRKK
ncbi:MAG: hypothetical protein L3I99_01955 [Sulfurimonas sp.]|nr:hypothetical protein [Sulfurimonas sp.]